MNLPKLSTLVVALVLATGCVLQWYLDGTNEVRAARIAVELEIARYTPSEAPCLAPAPRPSRLDRVGPLEIEPTPIATCPLVPCSDRA